MVLTVQLFQKRLITVTNDEEAAVPTVDVRGVRSDVTRRAEPFNETVGHVLFLDCEDTDVTKLEDWCELNLQVYYIFKSSQGNYHVISPVIRSAIEIYNLKKSCPFDDDEHNRIGYDKRGWVLRFTEKGDKPRPDLVKAVNGVTDRPISEPHVSYIIQEFESDAAIELIREGRECLGYAIKVVEYATYERHKGEDDGLQ